MATTIIIKLGYTNLAIPYSDKRVSALVDLMENVTQVKKDWHGNFTEAVVLEQFIFEVVQQEIPVYVSPETKTNEQED